MSSSAALELDAPAKLNLFLEVLGARPDGYHDLDSVFAEIDLADRVRLERADSVSLEVVGEEAPADASNLAWRAAEALGVGARIRLEKRIPAGAGLGGGSSDAAAVLRGLDRLYDLGTGRERLLGLARALGADVPYFLTGGLARCRGVGDRVEPVPGGPARRFVLACPAISTSTKEVYGALGSGLTGKRETATVFLRSYLDSGPGTPSYFNRLQAAAERLDARLRDVRLELEERFEASFTMTGSGSAYFAELEPGAGPDRFETRGGVPVRVWRVATES